MPKRKLYKIRPSTLRNFEKVCFSLRTERNNIRKFITERTIDSDNIKGNFRDNNFIYTGKTNYGTEYTQPIKIPNELLKPREFDSKFYPINENLSGFSDSRKYNYLCNFNISSFNRYKEKYINEKGTVDAIVSRAVSDLINESAQTRFSNIHVNLAAIVLYCETYNVHNDVILIIKNLYELWEQLPFDEHWNEITFQVENVSSMWPMLFISLWSICFDIICDNVSTVAGMVAWQIHLEDAIDSLQDTRLKKKGSYFLWEKDALDKLNTAIVPGWTAIGNVTKPRIKSTKEIWYKGERQEAEVKMKEDLSDTYMKYLTHVRTKIKTPEDIIRMDTEARCMRDGRIYYATLPELALRDAIGPRIYGTVLENPIPTKWIAGDKAKFLEAKYKEGTFIRQMQDLADRYFDKLQSKAKLDNLEKEFINYLSTSSAGKKIDDTEEVNRIFAGLTKELKRLVKGASSARVVQQALSMSKLYTMNHLIKECAGPIPVVTRKQIERRQRAIAGLNNSRLFINILEYLALKEFLGISPMPSHGKQTGSFTDLLDYLWYTTHDDIVISSLDVSGMDASIQVALQMFQKLKAMKIYNAAMKSDYGPFKSTQYEVEDINGKREMITIAGTALAMIYSIGMKTNTSFKSKLFGEIVTKIGVYLSGLFTTSQNHTDIGSHAIVAQNEAFYRYVHESLQKVIRVVLHKAKVLGDDLGLILSGTNEDVDLFITHLITKFSEIGLELVKSESRNMGEYLQQKVILGRYNGYANRVSLVTAENYKTRMNVPESLSEVGALCNDLSARTYNVNALAAFMPIFAYLTHCKQLISVKEKDYSRLHDALSKRTLVYTYDTPLQSGDRVIGYHLPYMLMFLSGGGLEAPAPMFETADGTYTEYQSIYKPKGDFSRHLLFHLSRSNVLNNKVLEEYNIPFAQALIDSKVLIEDKTYREKIVADNNGLISQMARALESVEHSNARDRSRMAASKLRLAGYRLPDNGVYGYQLAARLRQSIIDQTDFKDEIRYINASIAEKLIKCTNVKIVPTRKGDRLHAMQLEYTNNPIHVTSRYADLRNISIAKSYAPGSDAWMLFCAMDFKPSAANALALEIGHAQAHFKNFKYDQPTFDEGLKMYNNDRVLLDDFFTAINVSGAAREAWLRAFEYHKQFKNFIYPLQYSPRNMFYLSTNPLDYMSIIEPTAPGQPNAVALYYQRIFALLLTYSHTICDRRATLKPM